MNDDLRLLTEQEVADLLGLSISGMRKLRAAGTAPFAIRLSRRAIRYPVKNLREWLLASEPASSAARGTVIPMTKGGSRGG